MVIANCLIKVKLVLKEKIREALKEVVDPELGYNVVDLGLIREVEVLKEKVVVKVVLTTPLCPVGPYIFEAIKKKAEEVSKMPAEVVWEEGVFWTPEMMSEELRKKLGI